MGMRILSLGRYADVSAFLLSLTRLDPKSYPQPLLYIWQCIEKGIQPDVVLVTIILFSKEDHP